MNPDDARYADQIRKLQEESAAVKEASTRERTIDEEWSEIVILQGMLVDRIDRLVTRAGCKDRRELMARLARRPASST